MTKAELKQFQVEVSKMPAGRYKTLMLEVARLAVIGWEQENNPPLLSVGDEEAAYIMGGGKSGQDVVLDASR